jgi:hypothetical protein
MARPPYVDRISEESVPLDRILLDPNNPRLIGTGSTGTASYQGVPEDRVSEETVQESTLAKLNSQRAFDLDSLRASIANSGLLPVDRIVVRPIAKADGGDQTYVVVEGNRRIAACKTLLQQHNSGEKTLSDEILSTIRKPQVLVLSEDSAVEARLDQWVIQGIRHISGIRPWGAYQASKTIEAMLTKLDYSEQEVSRALSIGVARIRRSMRVLAALQQMAESDDYAEYSGPDMYAYFDEVLKRPAVRNWLGWSDDSSTFEQDDRLLEFYSWITPDDELEGRRRIPVAESVRRLDDVLQDKNAIAILNQPGSTIDDAVRVVTPFVKSDWTDPVNRALQALADMPTSDLENLTEEDQQLVRDLIDLATRRLGQAASFAQT